GLHQPKPWLPLAFRGAPSRAFCAFRRSLPALRREEPGVHVIHYTMESVIVDVLNVVAAHVVGVVSMPHDEIHCPAVMYGICYGPERMAEGVEAGTTLGKLQLLHQLAKFEADAVRPATVFARFRSAESHPSFAVLRQKDRIPVAIILWFGQLLDSF